MSEWLMGLKICAQDGATDDDVGVAMPQMDMLKLQSGCKLVLLTTYTLKFKPHALSFRQDKSVPSKNAWAVVPSLQNAQWCEIISKTSLFLLR